MRRLPAWRPEIYQLHQRVVDLEGYIHVNGHIYSVPYELIGKPVEVRESKDKYERSRFLMDSRSGSAMVPVPVPAFS
jgi:hypothetical protein